MKVLHVISCLVEADGHALFCGRLAAELQRKGIVNRILTCPHVDGLSGWLPPHSDVAIHVIPGYLRRVLNIAWVRDMRQTAAREMSQFSPDIVHVHGLWHPIIHEGMRAAVRRRLPVVASAHGMLTPWALRHHAWRKRLAWHLYQRRDLQLASVLHAAAAREAEELRQRGLRQAIAIVPLGVDGSAQGPEAEVEAQRIRTILFLSRIHPGKGLLNLVDAWVRVRQPGWRLRIAGPDEDGHQSLVARHAEACGVVADIDFVGPLYGIAKEEAYQEADVFVLPSHSENFGVVVLEALACGVPVIATRATPWEELQTNRCGWWIDVGVEPLAVALQEAMQRTDVDRQIMGHRGAAMVRERYSWDRIGCEIARVYHWALGHSPRPDCVQI